MYCHPSRKAKKEEEEEPDSSEKRQGSRILSFFLFCCFAHTVKKWMQVIQKNTQPLALACKWYLHKICYRPARRERILDPRALSLSQRVDKLCTTVVFAVVGFHAPAPCQSAYFALDLVWLFFPGRKGGFAKDARQIERKKSVPNGRGSRIGIRYQSTGSAQRSSKVSFFSFLSLSLFCCLTARAPVSPSAEIAS